MIKSLCLALVLLCSPCHSGQSRASFVVGIRIVGASSTVVPAATTTVNTSQLGAVKDGQAVGACYTPPNRKIVVKCTVKK